MAEKIEWPRDRSRVEWKATIIFNMIRALVGGIVVAVVAAIMSKDFGKLAIIIVAPLGWLLVCLPAWLIAQKLPPTPKGIIAFIFVLPFFLIEMLGDPFIFIVSKVKPDWLPVESPAIINFIPIFFALKPAAVKPAR